MTQETTGSRSTLRIDPGKIKSAILAKKNNESSTRVVHGSRSSSHGVTVEVKRRVAPSVSSADMTAHGAEGFVANAADRGDGSSSQAHRSHEASIAGHVGRPRDHASTSSDGAVPSFGGSGGLTASEQQARRDAVKKAVIAEKEQSARREAARAEEALLQAQKEAVRAASHMVEQSDVMHSDTERTSLDHTLTAQSTPGDASVDIMLDVPKTAIDHLPTDTAHLSQTNEVQPSSHAIKKHRPHAKGDHTHRDEDEDVTSVASKKHRGDKRSPRPEKPALTTSRRKDDLHVVARLVVGNSESLYEEEERRNARNLAAIRRMREKERAKQRASQMERIKIVRDVVVPEVITVQELANRMAERVHDVIRELMKLGMIVTSHQTIDADTAELIVESFGHHGRRIAESDVENILLHRPQDDEAMKKPRPPVVTVMGHVDHGKTSLLDALRQTDIVAGESGGITQHIGAYQVVLPSGELITFLDTPGHEAFTAMRARGVRVTDIVILVVAADDGIKPQTIEAIHHAKAAHVPIIVAINKMDKPDANSEKVRQALLLHDLVPESLGGDVQIVEISAKTGYGLDALKDAILVQAEMLELKANPGFMADGVVVESSVDKTRGVLTTFLVQRGTLRQGDIVVAGSTYGRVRMMYNDKGMAIECALPSMPVGILGLTNAPEAGDVFSVVEHEKQARDISEFRARRARDLRDAASHKHTLDELFQRASSMQVTKTLPIIVKADVHGSVEAIVHSISNIRHAEVVPQILHSAVGSVTESDIALAQASHALIIAFHVRTTPQAQEMLSTHPVDLRFYQVIYDVVDDIRRVVTGMLRPIFREEMLAVVKVRQIFSISRIGNIAGVVVSKGLVKRHAKARVKRADAVIFEGTVRTLKRFKEDVKEVREGFECGIGLEGFEDMREGDVLEIFELIEEAQQL